MVSLLTVLVWLLAIFSFYFSGFVAVKHAKNISWNFFAMTVSGLAGLANSVPEVSFFYFGVTVLWFMSIVVLISKRD